MLNRNALPAMKNLLSWMEANPELELPLSHMQLYVCDFGENKAMQQLATYARSFGQAEKVYKDQWFSVVKDFDGIKLEVFTDRAAVCERKVVGKKIVPAVNIPEHEEEIVEWDCHGANLLEGTESDGITNSPTSDLGTGTVENPPRTMPERGADDTASHRDETLQEASNGVLPSPDNA